MKLLLKSYESKKQIIRQRLAEFKKFYNEPYSWFYTNNCLQLKKVNRNDNERLFEELCFCILTARASAKMGLKGVDAIRDVIINGSVIDIRKRLNGVHRYPNRAEYIVHTRKHLIMDINFELKKKIENSDNTNELREWIIRRENGEKAIKGIGMKEASHFLRNIGYGEDVAILDMHILNSLKQYGVIDIIPPSMTIKKYIEIEEKMKQFAEKADIPLAELDLLLWSNKTGEILK